MNHNLSDEYLARVERLEHTHPPAYRFLTRVQNEGPASGLWLSTVTNAHLYKENAFLAYLKLGGASSLSLSPTFHQQIAADTTDRSAVLFTSVLKRLVMDSHGFSQKWATQGKGGEVELKSNAPDTFFDELFLALSKLRTEPT